MQNIIFHNIKENSFFDARGWVANPFQLPGFPHEFGHLHVVSMNPGTVRGNHYHRTARELLFAFGGDYLIEWGFDKIDQERAISAGEMFVLEIPPGVMHRIKNVSDSVIYLLSFQNAAREEIASDTVKL